jgi:T5SS/PEP-CTERM-associated repeat protein
MGPFSVRVLPFALAFVLPLVASPLPSSAAITATSGTASVSPANPGTWTNTTTGYVGNTADGAVTVNGGNSVVSDMVYLGYNSGVTGTATIDGAGSSWTGNNLYIGNGGSGTVTVSGGGAASISNWCLIGVNGGATGVMNISGAGTIVSAYHVSVAAGLNGYSTGTLNVNEGATLYTSSVGGAEGIWIGYGTAQATVDGAGSSLINRGGGFSVTSSSSATLTIRNGGTVTTQGNGAFIAGDPWGNPPTPSGLITVDGAGSALNIVGEQFNVGYYGRGTLVVTRGANVTSASATIASLSASSGVARVDGSGSKWTLSNALAIGSGGTAQVSITGGGAINSAGSVSINNQSLLAVDVGHGSTLTVGGGTGTLQDNGTVRLLAAADVPAGSKWTPISVETCSGSGTFQTLGGLWNAGNATFTTSSDTAGTSGSPVALNLASIQRALVEDTHDGWEVGASFVAATSAHNATFTATAISGATLDALLAMLPANEHLAGGWSFATTNYTVSAANPAYLSFNVGPGRAANTLAVWHFDGSNWAPFAPVDLTDNGSYASFTASSFSAYAVSCTPEPSTVALLGVGVLCSAACIWICKRSSVEENPV